MRTRRADAERPIPPVAMPAWPGRRHVHLIDSELRGLDGARRAAVLHAMACALDAHLTGVADHRAGREGVEAALDELLKQLRGAWGTKARPGAAKTPASVPSSARTQAALGQPDGGAPR